MSQELVDTLTVDLMHDGITVLQADKNLPRETVDMVKSLVDHRPEHVVESERVHYLTAMAGVTLGLGLAKNQQKLEDAGGFAAVAEKYLGPEAAEILRRGE